MGYSESPFDRPQGDKVSFKEFVTKKTLPAHKFMETDDGEGDCKSDYKKEEYLLETDIELNQSRKGTIMPMKVTHISQFLEDGENPDIIDLRASKPTE